jgi:hypothetical protein
MDWEPETQDLIDAAGLEVTPEKVNVAVRQWLRQILRQREYKRKLKVDPERHEKQKAIQREHRREYRDYGAKGCKRDAEDFVGRKLPIRKRIPEDDMAYRMEKLLKDKREKPKDVLILGGM